MRSKATFNEEQNSTEVLRLAYESEQLAHDECSR
jgi:hypothetical protein